MDVGPGAEGHQQGEAPDALGRRCPRQAEILLTTDDATVIYDDMKSTF